MTPQTSPALACTVVSFVPFDIREEKPGLIPGRFFLAASDTKTPTVLHVRNSIHYVYLDETRGSLIARDPSDEVSRAIVGDFVSSQLGLTETARPAIFWLPGILNPEEILEKHKDRVVEELNLQNQWFTELMRIADDDWQRYHKHTVISDFQRKIANILQLDPEKHEWVSLNIKADLKTHDCPACFSPIDPRAVICPNCRTNLQTFKAEAVKQI